MLPCWLLLSVRGNQARTRADRQRDRMKLALVTQLPFVAQHCPYPACNTVFSVEDQRGAISRGEYGSPLPSEPVRIVACMTGNSSSAAHEKHQSSRRGSALSIVCMRLYSTLRTMSL